MKRFEQFAKKIADEEIFKSGRLGKSESFSRVLKSSILDSWKAFSEDGDCRHINCSNCPLAATCTNPPDTLQMKKWLNEDI